MNRQLIVAAGAMVGALLALFVLRPAVSPIKHPPVPTLAVATAPARIPAHLVDAPMLKEQAWQQIRPLLSKTDQTIEKQLGQRFQQVEAFFSERQRGSRRMAEALLALSGKWNYATSNDAEYAKYVQKLFAEHLFSDDELKQLLENITKAAIKDIEAEENKLLIGIRADLQDNELLAEYVIPSLQSDSAWKANFRSMVQHVAPSIASDIQLGIGSVIGSAIISQIASDIVVRVASAVATKLGISSTVLGTGALSGWATFGLGVALGFAADWAIDKVSRWFGHDPEGEISAKIDANLRTLQTELRQALQAEVVKFHQTKSKLRYAALERVFQPHPSK